MLVAFVVVALLARSGRAAEPSAPVPAPDEMDDEGSDVAPAAVVFRLEPRGAAVSVEAVAGLAVEQMSDNTRAHQLAGAMVRLHLGLAEVGGSYWTTDSGEATALDELVQEHYREVGAFAGGFLPYRRWVDFDGALGLASRIYANPSRVYGPGGLSVSTAALTARVGVSARSGRALLAARVGAALVTSIDLARREVTEHHYFLENGVQQDVTRQLGMGGVSIALVLSCGIEIGGGS